jgi:thiol-disulfide isomerase/thioredoxin
LRFPIMFALLPLALTACDPDVDEDGLLASEEAELGTDPEKADTDGDGLSDFVEARELGTDPLAFDSDGDGFSDGEENTAGTDPLFNASWPADLGRWPDNSASLAEADLGWGLGDQMYNWTAIDQHGDQIALHQFAGHAILLDLSAGWCGPCRAVASGAQAEWEQHKDQGFLIIHLMTDDNRGGGGVTDDAFLNSWSTEYGLKFPVVDNENGAALAGLSRSGLYPGSIPFMVLLDQELKIVDTATGNGAQVGLINKALVLLAE